MDMGFALGFLVGFSIAVAGGTFYYHYAVKRMKVVLNLRHGDKVNPIHKPGHAQANLHGGPRYPIIDPPDYWGR